MVDPVRALAASAEKVLRWVQLDDLVAMQGAVGGLIQRIELRDGCSLWVNEEGKIEGLPFNSIGTDLAQLNRAIFFGDTVVGDVFITGPGDGAGGDQDLSLETRTFRQVQKIAGEAGGRWRISICRDTSCPECRWPETYAEGFEQVGVDTIGCRKCGWKVEQPLDTGALGE